MSLLSSPPPPSSEEVRKAVEEDPTSNQCRTLVLQILTSGTTVVHDETSSLQERTNIAATVLTDAWEECPVLEDVLVDCLWLCSSILSTSPDADASTTALIEILKSLLQVPDRTSFWTKLQCNLVPTLLEASGLASEQELLKKLKIHNTQVHYKQQKYNLLQEESEGYSKVLHFLVSGCHQEEDANQQLCRLRQLIGAFELDPNRVLDILLDVLEAKLYPSELDSSSSSSPAAPKQQESSSGQPSKRRRPSTKDDPNISWLLELVKDFSIDKVPPLIGFKLTGKEEGGHVSAHLEQTIAFLAAEHVLDLTVMVKEYLPPIADQIQEAHEVHWAKEKLRLQALGRLSLTATPKEDPKQTELERRLEQLLETLVNTQVVRLLLTLLDWYEWDLVKPLLSREQWSKLCTLFPDKFGFALCDLAQAKVRHWSSSRVSTISLLPSTPNDETTATTTPISQPLDMVEADEMISELTLDMVVRELSDPLLCTVQSCCIKSRPVLFCLLCRLFHSLLSSSDENNDDAGSQFQLSHDTYTFFKEFMVPSLSLFPSNPAISTELWSVLKCLPYPIRYRLYRDCMGVDLRLGTSSTSGKPLLQVESDMKAGQGTRYTLRRLSKENVRDNGRTLSKVAQSNPHVVYATILSQIESYDNMVGMMVDSQRFASALSLDVLGYCILSRLSGMAGGVNRNRLKEDGVNVSQWLQSLESFAGAFFKRWSDVEFRGILCYLMRRLREGNVLELGMLRTLLKIPGGYSFADYSPASSLNISQLEGRAGSLTLKRETMSFGIVEDMDHQASSKIRDVFQSDGLGVSMLILIAQVRSSIIFESTKMPLKLIGNLHDSCQVVLSVLMEFLTNTFASSAEGEKGAKTRHDLLVKYADTMPTLAELHSKYGFDVVSAWALCRPLVRAATTMARTKVLENGTHSNTDGQDRLKLFELDEDTRNAYKKMVPATTWSAISPDLFECFFTNGLYDIFCPEHVYDAQTQRIGKEIEKLQLRQRSGATSFLHPVGGAPKGEDADIAKLEVAASKLAADLTQQKEHVSIVLDTLKQNKSSYFPVQRASRYAVETFLTQCLFPRSMQSPDDALYCARFAALLHEMETPGFSSMHYIDSLVGVVSGALVCVTEGEAANLSILLWETWTVVNKWRYDEAIYDEEVAAKPGAYIEQETEALDESDEKDGSLSYKDFAGLFNKWHSTLGNALIGCLKSPEYMHTRAGLLVLTRIVDVFPTQPIVGNKFLEVLTPLQDDGSSRPDIRASASAYASMLLKAQNEGRWVEEDAAVAKARIEKDRAVADERKRRIEEQFNEMKRESEKITEEIGPRDGPRDRHDRRRTEFGDGKGPSQGEPNRTKSPMPTNADENGGAGRKDDQVHRTSDIRGESGEISSRDRREHQDRRGETTVRSSSPREADTGRERERAATDERGRTRNESNTGQHGRSIEKQPGSDVRRREGVGTGEAQRAPRDEGRGLGARWSRGDAAAPVEGRGRGSKRSRPSSPETGNDSSRVDRGSDTRESGRNSKRPRAGGSSSGGDFEPRQENSGSSPSRRRGGSPPRTPPPRATRRARR